MAVELAKVSLWLDAFTLGAPLSFLDHHLRCGNSLIGTTFEHLKKATSGQLLGIDHTPLLRAIGHVLFVNEMSDATAAEVHKSADEYSQARRNLSGYQIVLDLLVGDHFVDQPATGHGSRATRHVQPSSLIRDTTLDLTTRDTFLAPLKDNARRTVAETEAIARRPDLRFFHWEIEFPEVFFGFSDANRRQINHRNDIAAGSAGFDAIVGNPPYAGHKGDFDARPLTTFFDVCRDYPNYATAFVEQSLRQLRRSGRYGLIIPKSIQYVDSWEAARRLMLGQFQLNHLVDVSQAFEEVLLEQTICVGAKLPPSSEYLAAAMSAAGKTPDQHVPFALVEFIGSLPVQLDGRSLSLFERIRTLGPRLGDIANTNQALGYQAMINKRMTGETVPIYRGKQVRPMRVDPPDDWIDIHFLRRKDSDELTDKVQEMLRPKVVSQNIVAHVTTPKPRVWVISAPDDQGIVCLNTISVTAIHDSRFPARYVSALLNSSLASWFYYEFVFCRAIRTMHFDQYYAGKLPIPVPSHALLEQSDSLAHRCREDALPRAARQIAIDEVAFEAYKLSAGERLFVLDYCYGTTDLHSVLSGF